MELPPQASGPGTATCGRTGRRQGGRAARHVRTQPGQRGHRQRRWRIPLCQFELAQVDEAGARGAWPTPHLETYFDPQDRVALLQEMAERGSVRDREMRYRRSDGETVWAL